MGKQRILLVEDDARFREDFARTLQRAMAAESLDLAFVEAGSLATTGWLHKRWMRVRRVRSRRWSRCRRRLRR